MLIIDKPHYKLSVDKNPVLNPSSRFELYLTEEEIKMIKDAL